MLWKVRPFREPANPSRPRFGSWTWCAPLFLPKAHPSPRRRPPSPASPRISREAFQPSPTTRWAPPPGDTPFPCRTSNRQPYRRKRPRIRRSPGRRRATRPRRMIRGSKPGWRCWRLFFGQSVASATRALKASWARHQPWPARGPPRRRFHPGRAPRITASPRCTLGSLQPPARTSRLTVSAPSR